MWQLLSKKTLEHMDVEDTMMSLVSSGTWARAEKALCIWTGVMKINGKRDLCKHLAELPDDDSSSIKMLHNSVE